MVFATLTQKDKEALFALLDEYFESRPELFQSMNQAASPPPTHAPNPPTRPLSPSRMANSIQNGARNLLKSRVVPPAPMTSSSTSSFTSAAAVSSPPPAIPARQLTPRIVEPEPVQAQEEEEVDEAPVSVSSRIAAAQAAIGNTIGSGKPPIPTPRRTSGTVPPPPSNKPSTPTNKTSPPPRPLRPSPSTSGLSTPTYNNHSEANNSSTPTTSNLVTSRGIGSIDTSSAGSAATTIFSFKGVGKNEKKPTGVYMPQTPAFDKPKTRELFAPPPRRDPASAGTSPAQNNQVTLEQEEEEEQEEEAKGEWCVALYDFSSSEPTDLSFKADDQIWVTQRTSKDWWMAEIDGREGLVPAAYVKPM